MVLPMIHLAAALPAVAQQAEQLPPIYGSTFGPIPAPSSPQRIPEHIVDHLIERYKPPPIYRQGIPAYTDRLYTIPPKYYHPPIPHPSFRTPEYQMKQEVPPIDAGAALRDWYTRTETPLENALLNEFTLANSSPCNAAAINWARAVIQLDGHLQEANRNIRDLSRLLTPDEKQMFRKYAEEYENSCLSGPEHISRGLLPQNYKKVVAVLLLNKIPFCGALRIAQNAFVTARHCFFKKDDLSGSVIESRQHKVTLAILADPMREFAVHRKLDNSGNIADNSRNFSDKNDYIFLTTEPMEADMPPTVAKLPAVADRIILLGYFRYHQPKWVFANENRRGPRQHWSLGMRWSKAPLCRVGPISDPCVSHFCQSSAGFSGTPMLVPTRELPIRYYGIHIGTMSAEKGACEVDTRSKAGNMGIRVNLSHLPHKAS